MQGRQNERTNFLNCVPRMVRSANSALLTQELKFELCRSKSVSETAEPKAVIT